MEGRMYYSLGSYPLAVIEKVLMRAAASYWSFS